MRALRFTAPATALFVIVSASPPSRAEVESEQVKAGVAAYESLEYQQAIEDLQRALGETLTVEEKVVTYKTMAFCHVALGQPDQARQDFEQLLTVEPDFQLDQTISPRVRAVFESARAEVATQKGVPTGERPALPTTTPAIAPASPREGQAVVLRTDYPGGVAVKMELFYRTRGQFRFSRVASVGHDGRFTATIPGMGVAPPALEYYVDLLDDSGVPVAGAGSLGRPLAVRVIARPKPIYKRALFWGVLGGVVAAGAIVGGVLAAVLPTHIGPDTPATLTIQPH